MVEEWFAIRQNGHLECIFTSPRHPVLKIERRGRQEHQAYYPEGDDQRLCDRWSRQQLQGPLLRARAETSPVEPGLKELPDGPYGQRAGKNEHLAKPGLE